MNNIAFINKDEQVNEQGNFAQLNTYYDEKFKVGWFLMKARPRPCFTPTLLENLSDYLNQVKSEMKSSGGKQYDYLVVGSEVPGIFNLGGDLDLFTRLIHQRNRDQLLGYAIHCIDILYQNMHHYNTDLTTISLIQGDALGGGFEAALSSNIIIAERGVKMGLPEVLFNLFPGMGAFSLLSRKVGPARAEQMILSGKIYKAEELQQMGVVDILAEPEEGELAVYQYIETANRASNSYRAMRQVKDICNNISYQELTRIANVWADAALNLTERDIRMMQRLVNRQNKRLKA